MTLRAGHSGVQPRERIPGLSVVEQADVLPRRGVVAGLTILAELALVKVLMAGQARLGEPKEALVQIFLFDQVSPLRLDMRSRVAVLALDARVFALQWVSGLRMVEFLFRWLPANELKLFPIVLGMAARAVFVGIVPLHDRRVKSQVGDEPLIDFGMTLQTLQAASRRRKSVAGGALAYAGNRLMGFGKRPR